MLGFFIKDVIIYKMKKLLLLWFLSVFNCINFSTTKGTSQLNGIYSKLKKNSIYTASGAGVLIVGAIVYNKNKKQSSSSNSSLVLQKSQNNLQDNNGKKDEEIKSLMGEIKDLMTELNQDKKNKEKKSLDQIQQSIQTGIKKIVSNNKHITETKTNIFSKLGNGVKNIFSNQAKKRWEEVKTTLAPFQQFLMDCQKDNVNINIDLLDVTTNSKITCDIENFTAMYDCFVERYEKIIASKDKDLIKTANTFLECVEKSPWIKEFSRDIKVYYKKFTEINDILSKIYKEKIGEIQNPIKNRFNFDVNYEYKKLSKELEETAQTLIDNPKKNFDECLCATFKKTSQKTRQNNSLNYSFITDKYQLALNFQCLNNYSLKPRSEEKKSSLTGLSFNNSQNKSESNNQAPSTKELNLLNLSLHFSSLFHIFNVTLGSGWGYRQR
jgi:hypothetical protein